MDTISEQLIMANPVKLVETPPSTIVDIPGLGAVSVPVSKGNLRKLETLAVDYITTQSGLGTIFTNSQNIFFNIQSSQVDKLKQMIVKIVLQNQETTDAMILSPSFNLFQGMYVKSSQNQLDLSYPHNYVYNMLSLQSIDTMNIYGKLCGFNPASLATTNTIAAGASLTIYLPLWNILTKSQFALSQSDGSIQIQLQTNSAADLFSSTSTSTDATLLNCTEMSLYNIGTKLYGIDKENLIKQYSGHQRFVVNEDAFFQNAQGTQGTAGQTVNATLSSVLGTYTNMTTAWLNNTWTSYEVKFGLVGSTNYATHLFDQVALKNNSGQYIFGINNIPTSIIQYGIPLAIGYDSGFVTQLQTQYWDFASQRGSILEGDANAGAYPVQQNIIWSGVASSSTTQLQQIVTAAQRMTFMYVAPSGKITVDLR